MRLDREMALNFRDPVTSLNTGSAVGLPVVEQRDATTMIIVADTLSRGFGRVRTLKFVLSIDAVRLTGRN